MNSFFPYGKSKRFGRAAFIIVFGNRAQEPIHPHHRQKTSHRPGKTHSIDKRPALLSSSTTRLQHGVVRLGSRKTGWSGFGVVRVGFGLVWAKFFVRVAATRRIGSFCAIRQENLARGTPIPCGTQIQYGVWTGAPGGRACRTGARSGQARAGPTK